MMKEILIYDLEKRKVPSKNEETLSSVIHGLKRSTEG